MTVQTNQMNLDLLDWTNYFVNLDQLASSHLYLPLLKFINFAHYDWVIFAMVQYWPFFFFNDKRLLNWV